jgi:hypothetical protein
MYDAFPDLAVSTTACQLYTARRDVEFHVDEGAERNVPFRGGRLL